MSVHIETQNTDMGLVQEFLEYSLNESHKHDIIDNGKHKKGQVNKSGKRKNHVQHNKDVEHWEVKMCSATNQFPELQFLGQNHKP